MTALIDQLWELAEPTLYITKDEFVKSLEGWEIEPIEIDGVVALITMTKGALFHFVSMKTGKPFSMKVVRGTIGRVIEQHGYAETRTPKDDVRMHRFNNRLGFKAIGEDALDTHFRIERLP